MVEWWTRHSRSRRRRKGNVGVENEKEKQEGERMERFFYVVYEFLSDFNFNFQGFRCHEFPL